MNHSTCLAAGTESLLVETATLPQLPRWDDLGCWPEGQWRWPYLTSSDVDVVLAAARRLGGRPGVQFVGADCVIDLAGTTIDDHVTALPTRQRRANFRREERRFADSGLEIRPVGLADHWDRLGPLLTAAQRGYGRRYAADELSARAVVFACFDGDLIVGFSLAFERGTELALRVVDLDCDRPAEADVYAQLAVHAPLRYCYQRGLRRLQLGTELYQAKCRRGARPRPLWAVTSSPSPDAGSHTSAIRRIAAALPAREAASFATQAEQEWRTWTWFVD